MPAELAFGSGMLYAFLLVLARIAGALVFIPFPGMGSGTELPRIVAALSITIALLPSWPKFDTFPSAIAAVVLAILVEAVFGLSIGLAVACLLEVLRMGAQIMSAQAGFGYASTIDPTSSADSGLLVIAAGMMGGLLFFALGIDHEVIRVLAASLVAHPPGSFHADTRISEALIHFASDIFTVGVRLALPSIALLGLIDLSLGLLGRINAHLHLISVSFPLKMLAALILVAALAGVYPRVLASESRFMLQISRHAAGLEDHGR